MAAELKMGEPSVTEFNGPPQVPSEQSWITRSANFAVRLTRAKAGTSLYRDDNPDEYFVLLPETGATVAAGVHAAEAGRGTLLLLPPGESQVVANGEGVIVSIFSAE